MTDPILHRKLLILIRVHLGQLPATARLLSQALEYRPEDLARAANELMDPDRLVIVVVGDASEVQESLEAIAPVSVVTDEG